MFLVTRPQPKADETVQALIAQGLTAHAMPAISIETFQPSTAIHAKGYDILIVTSTYTEAFLHDYAKHLTTENSAFICVGQSTADMLKSCLASHHLSCPVQIAEPQNSEGVIRLLSLLTVSDKKVAIIKGQDGRTAIADYLLSQGVTSDLFEVYKRCPTYIQTNMNQVDGQTIKCIIVTSVDIAEQIFEHFDSSWLKTRVFMVASQRIYDYVQAKGASKVVLAESASTASIVKCANQLHLSGVLDDKR